MQASANNLHKCKHTQKDLQGKNSCGTGSAKHSPSFLPSLFLTPPCDLGKGTDAGHYHEPTVLVPPTELTVASPRQFHVIVSGTSVLSLPEVERREMLERTFHITNGVFLRRHLYPFVIHCFSNTHSNSSVVRIMLLKVEKNIPHVIINGGRKKKIGRAHV